jgi:hypothetical protein
MPEKEALFFLEMAVMIKKIREKASAFRTKEQQALGTRRQEKSPQSHQFWISDSILRLNSVSARSEKRLLNASHCPKFALYRIITRIGLSRKSEKRRQRAHATIQSETHPCLYAVSLERMTNATHKRYVKKQNGPNLG